MEQVLPGTHFGKHWSTYLFIHFKKLDNLSYALHTTVILEEHHTVYKVLLYLLFHLIANL